MKSQGEGIISNDFANQVRQTGQWPDVATQSFMDAEKQSQLDTYNQNRKERKKYADLIYCFTCVYCIFVFIILFGAGLHKLVLSDLILTTLLGTTTANALGFFYLVTQYLFNKDNPK